MRDTKLRLSLLGILLLGIQLSPCHGLCSLVNGTVARCHDLDDVKYIDTYDLGTLKTSTSGNRLHADIFRNLSSLRHLELTHGELQHIEPGTFRQLRELLSLDLSQNKIESLEPTAFDGLKKLRVLNLRKNDLKQIPTALVSLKNMKVLDISGNPLNCNCRALKVRDLLVGQGVLLSKRILCTSPANLKGKSLVDPDTQVICMFEDQDKEMQKDQPAVEGSGEIPPGDPFDDLTSDETDEEELEIVDNATTASPAEVETPAPTKSPYGDDLIIPVVEQSTAPPAEVETPAPMNSSHDDDLIIPDVEQTTAAPEVTATGAVTSPTTESSHDEEPIIPAVDSEPSTTETPVETSTKTDDEIFFSEESGKHASTTPLPAISTESAEEVETTATTDKKPLLRQPAIPVEGSGEEEDLQEGSGIEGSGTGVPPIVWNVPDVETGAESTSTSPAKEDGWISLLWDMFPGTSAPPEDDATKDLDLQEEQFISASSEPTPTSSSKSPVEEAVIVPGFVKKPGVGKDFDTVVDRDSSLGRALDESKSGQVKAEPESAAKAAGASEAPQPQKGIGSYIVLAVLLGILGALIGLAAYKGEFCSKKRKRNDVERGTELKDMTKSLLDNGNGAQPKIASNGNLENVPLVSNVPLDEPTVLQKDSRTLVDGTKMRYSAVPDVVDPVKPPRKSFVAQEDPDKALSNGKSHQDLVNSSAPESEVRLRAKGEPAVNGRNHHDSVSSIGTDSRGSPSARTSPPESIPTNGSLGNLHGMERPPLSPGAQRVKITLQDNPDSLPKTPILITRTKAGENLVKTP